MARTFSEFQFLRSLTNDGQISQSFLVMVETTWTTSKRIFIYKKKALNSFIRVFIQSTLLVAK